MKKIDLSYLAEKWPSAVVARTEVPSFSGGSMSERYIANLDSAGEGPKGRFKIGRKVCYPVASLIEWLEGRAEPAMERVRGTNMVQKKEAAV